MYVGKHTMYLLFVNRLNGFPIRYTVYGYNKVTPTKRIKVALYVQEFLIEILERVGKFYTVNFDRVG